ncbi:MAG: hypothetical protein WCO53_14670, partial [Deltaproteobacteria bacterium]
LDFLAGPRGLEPLSSGVTDDFGSAKALILLTCVLSKMRLFCRIPHPRRTLFCRILQSIDETIHQKQKKANENFCIEFLHRIIQK